MIQLYRSHAVSRFALAALALVIAVLGSSFASLRAQEAAGTGTEKQADNQADWQTMVNRSVEFLRQRGQADDGSFSGQVGVGPTGLVVAALVSVGVPPEDPMVVKALDYLKEHVQPNGGIHTKQSLHQNYDTCIAMVAFAKANRDGRFDKIVGDAEKYVRGMQWDESEGKDASDLFFGGAGYGKHKRPDLSNTTFLVDALHELGSPGDDPNIQKALEFVSRCQNLESPYNTTEHAAKINDGGFYYTVAAGGETKAEVAENGGLRSYGSMTYAGLKSFVFAGLTDEDPRVKAALGFLRQNYTLEKNPGVGQQGLFYYYHTMAKALDAVGKETFEDAQGKSHDWKLELRGKLAELQQEDGSWINPTTRWMEGDPNLVSAYALLALAYCQP